MKKMIKTLTNTMYSLAAVLSIAFFAFVIGICGTLIATEYQDQKAHENSYEVICDVVAETEEFYILQNCDDMNEFIQVEKSEMYGVGETVRVISIDGQITSIWLYVDC